MAPAASYRELRVDKVANAGDSSTRKLSPKPPVSAAKVVPLLDAFGGSKRQPSSGRTPNQSKSLDGKPDDGRGASFRSPEKRRERSGSRREDRRDDERKPRRSSDKAARRDSKGDKPERRQSKEEAKSERCLSREEAKSERRLSKEEAKSERRQPREDTQDSTKKAARASSQRPSLARGESARGDRPALGRGESMRIASDRRDAKAREAARRDFEATEDKVKVSASFRRTVARDGGDSSESGRGLLKDVSECYLDELHASCGHRVGQDFLRRTQPVDWLDRDGGCGGLWCLTSGYRCHSRAGADGDAEGVRVAWSTLNFLGQGLHRVTYLGTYTGGPKSGQRCVVKRLLEGAYDEAMPSLMKLDLDVCDAAIALAGEFNETYDGTKTRKLRFNKSLALRVAAAGARSGFRDGEWITVEDFYPGRFEKLVGNNGLVNFENNRGSISTFCHWTYHRTNGRYLITDVQGVRPAREEIYLLTDPAIHSASGSRGGPLDHGHHGVLNFFASHECTNRCKHLLKPKDATDDELKRRKELLQAKPGGHRLDRGPDADDDARDPAAKPSGRHR
jgi:hypothetical protein